MIVLHGHCVPESWVESILRNGLSAPVCDGRTYPLMVWELENLEDAVDWARDMFGVEPEGLAIVLIACQEKDLTSYPTNKALFFGGKVSRSCVFGVIRNLDQWGD